MWSQPLVWSVFQPSKKTTLRVVESNKFKRFFKEYRGVVNNDEFVGSTNFGRGKSVRFKALRDHVGVSGRIKR